MPHAATFNMLRRALLAVCVFACFVAYAAPVSAAELCADLGFEGNNNNVPTDTGDGEGTGGDGIICRNFFAGVTGNNAAYYFFDFETSFEHLLRITVAEVVEDFGLAFMRNPLPAGTDFGIAGYTCLTYFEGGQCVEYESLNIVAGFYNGPVTWLIAWTPDIGTEEGEIVHKPDGSDTFVILTEERFFSPELGPNDFDCDLPYTTPCFVVDASVAKPDGPTDPVRAANSDDFSTAGVVEPTQVPEPGTLALLGLGAGGLLMNRRRRNAGR